MFVSNSRPDRKSSSHRKERKKEERHCLSKADLLSWLFHQIHIHIYIYVLLNWSRPRFLFKYIQITERRRKKVGLWKKEKKVPYWTPFLSLSLALSCFFPILTKPLPSTHSSYHTYIPLSLSLLLHPFLFTYLHPMHTTQHQHSFIVSSPYRGKSSLLFFLIALSLYFVFPICLLYR